MYIYIYIINIKEIIYLSWDGKTREGYIDIYIRRGILFFPFLRPAGKVTVQSSFSPWFPLLSQLSTKEIAPSAGAN